MTESRSGKVINIRDPRAFYRSHDNHQQTVKYEIRQPEWQDSNECMCHQQYKWTSVCCCEHLVWRRISSKRSPSSTYFCPALDSTLEISGQTTIKMEAFQVMHVSPVKYSDVWLPKQCDYRQTHRLTDAGQSDLCVMLCFAGDANKQNVSIPSKALRSERISLKPSWLIFALSWIHPRADLKKSLNTCTRP